MTTIIIPARYKSTRFPAKPLALIRGKESILWTVDAARRVKNAEEVYVATDDERIATVVDSYGCRVIMTSESCRNGTERVAEAATSLNLTDDEIIINFQGDAPLTPPWFVDAIISELKKRTDADLVTPVLRCDLESYRRFTDDRRNGRVGATTAIFDRYSRALYFSKEVIPFLPSEQNLTTTPVFHHVGIYGYKMKSLQAYPKWVVGPLEQAEQLEQLRFLEQGQAVYIIEVDARGVEFWELNNPEDVERIEAMMTTNPIL